MSFEIKKDFEWNGKQAMLDFTNARSRALLESAILVEGKAVKKVHVDTGALRQSITRAPSIPKNIAYVGTALEYAPYEEFGTRYRPAHPFLRPAFNTSLNAIKGIFKKIYKAVKYVD